MREYILREEFDPGSGWTLAGGLTHASRTLLRESGRRVRNTYLLTLKWGTTSETVLIRHNPYGGKIYRFKRGVRSTR